MPDVLRALRRTADSLPPLRDPSGFWEENQRRNSDAFRSQMLMLGIAMLLLWPTDLIVFRGDEAALGAFARLRVGYIVVAWCGALQRPPAHIFSAAALVVAAVTAFYAVTLATLGEGLIQHGWFYGSYLVPFAFAPMLLPLRLRFALTAFVAAFWLTLVYVLLGETAPTGFFGSAITYTAFSVMAASVVGRVVTCHAHRAFVFQRLLETSNAILEQRVSERTTKLRSVAARAVQLRERESRRVAHELHDDVGQILAGLHMEIGMLQRSHAPESFSHVSKLLTELGESIRRTLLHLRPRILDDLGPGEAIRWLCEETRRTANFKLRVTIPPIELQLTPNQGLALYRFVQEALTNAQKHAEANLVSVEFMVSKSHVVATVDDDGIGLRLENQEGLGLLGMKERALAVRAKLSVLSRIPRGTRMVWKLERSA